MKAHPSPMIRMARGLALLCFTITAATLLPSCASNTGSQGKPPVAGTTLQPTLYEWHGATDASGPTKVRIALNEQKAYIYKGDQQAGWTYLASGRGGFQTPQGTYRISEKKEQKNSSKYGIIVDSEGNVVDGEATLGVDRIPPGCRFVGASMPYWMRLTGNGIGMHAGNIPNPGYPASHGCIRLPRGMAATLYDVVDVGTVVTISGTAPRS
ncbi:L,D-transpeptidase family protein [Roseimicrobium sp. ORNL1]|uniref:L,D-transpeptidase family protein n=1 Tax=Roseimicrobium sp. ORNL1 TaxID=2711231 RepID=UPI0013E1A8D5|nr:L,D-transpeptidase family protein [Roseimicrobium sp. ORNL1]QIF03378.1 L,D-transpeptidase family protein [Roseimicrobium sp. ORNL1]